MWDAEFKCYDYVPEDVSDESLAEQLTYNPLTFRWYLNISKSTSQTKSAMSTAGSKQVSKINSNSEKLFDCDITFRVPTTELQERRGCKFGIINTCSENWEDTEVKTQCEAYTARIYSGKNLYRNHHCLLCNILAVPDEFSTTALYFGYEVNVHAQSFTMLLDWRRLKGGACSTSEIYDPLSRVCREVFI
jgi:hypothetical protein